VIAHAQRENSLVNLDSSGEKDKVRGLLVDWLDYEFLIVERDIPYLGPGETDFRRELIILLVDVQT